MPKTRGTTSIHLHFDLIGHGAQYIDFGQQNTAYSVLVHTYCGDFDFQLPTVAPALLLYLFFPISLKQTHIWLGIDKLCTFVSKKADPEPGVSSALLVLYTQSSPALV